VVTPAALRMPLRVEFAFNRKIDRGNPNPGNIGADFNRLGLVFWDEVQARDSRNKGRMDILLELNEWRNAIAHQDFDPARLGGSASLRLAQVRTWRSVCDALSVAFDAVMRDFIRSVIGVAPW
jgi:hypothetical protein